MSASARPDKQLPRLGAVERWRAEIRAGLRQNDFKHFDDLAAAACSELAARESAAEGDWARAHRFLDMARLRLAGYRGEPESNAGREILRQLKAKAPEKTQLPADWTAVPDAQGWR